MHHPLIDVKTIEQMPEPYIQTIGEVFARFDENTQDSGNISYGVRVDQTRYFIKTAGRPNDTQAYLEYPQRVALLRNAVRLKRQCSHTALPRLYQVIESPEGPLLVYEWLRGKLLHATSQVWNDPNSAFQRFRRLPASEILAALDVIYELHHELAQLGWIAVDFYDGCLIYDFAAQRLGVMDLDTYHQGPFINEMGRMFGSSRFMAPEEFERGAKIDQRTTVFTMGRTAAVLLSNGSLERQAFRGNEAIYQVIQQACREARHERFGSVAEFYAAWSEARTHDD